MCWRLLIGLAAAVLAAAACSSPQPSQSPEPSQASSGPGWQLVARKPNPLAPALRVTSVGDTVASVVLVVSGGCPDGGPATPTFTGFTVSGEIILAVVSRQPIPGQCLVTGGMEFDVLLDLRAVPASARTMNLGGQACPAGDDLCEAVSAPLPVHELAPPSG